MTKNNPTSFFSDLQSPFDFAHDDFPFRVEPFNAKYVLVTRVDIKRSIQAAKTEIAVSNTIKALATECPFCSEPLEPTALQKLYSKDYGWHQRQLADCPACHTTRVIGPRLPLEIVPVAVAA